jgi:hypothetical protein
LSRGKSGTAERGKVRVFMVCFCKVPRSWRVAHVQLLGAEKMPWAFKAPCLFGLVFWCDWLPVLYALHGPMQEPPVCTTDCDVYGFQAASRKKRVIQIFHGFQSLAEAIKRVRDRLRRRKTTAVPLDGGNDDDLIYAGVSRYRGSGFIPSQHDFSK